MVASLSWLAGELDALRDMGLIRQRKCITQLPEGWCEYNGRRLRNLAGNDYLNLAHHPAVIRGSRAAAKAGGSGVTASALVAGRSPWHLRLEEELARFYRQESALLYPTGYAANQGTIAALAGPEDVIFCDRHNHACLVDGCRLSQAKLRVYRHAELERLNVELKKAVHYRRKWIVTDSVFSMDGDLAPLRELSDLAEAHDAHLIVDEAHGFGVLGDHGRGAAELLEVEDRIAVRIGTLSKAGGSLGGFVAGPQNLIDWLWNQGRTQMFSTALPVSICGSALAALKIIQKEPHRRRHVLLLSDRLRNRLRGMGFDVPQGVGPIVPLILKTPEKTLTVAAELETAGFLVGAIRPPTVPEGTSRLRITVNAATTDQDLDAFCEALKPVSGTVE